MFYYLSQVERDFYRRILRASIFFLCLGLLLGIIIGKVGESLNSKYEHEKMQQLLTEKREKIADLESALGIKQGKHKPHHERKTK